MIRQGIILILLAISGCAPVNVSSSHDSSVDFSILKTYAWGNKVLEIDENGKIVNQNSDKIEKMASENILPITDSVLSAKGFNLADGNKPDFIISFVARGRAQSTLPANARMVTYDDDKQIRLGTFLMGLLSYTIVDANNNAIIWRGLAESPVTGTGENTERLEKLINEIFKDFPPKK